MALSKHCFVTFTLLSVVWAAVLAAPTTTTATATSDDGYSDLETVVNDTVVARDVVTNCSEGQFYCDGATTSGGKCIPLSWKYDGEFDCEDETDEPLTCREELKSADGDDDVNLETFVNDTVVATEVAANCSEGQFYCDGGTVSGGKCIPLSWKCDGEFDCEDETDEPLTCREELKKCSAQQFRCDDRCIPLMWKCDGEFDCADETDEPSTCGDESSGDQDEYDDDYFVEDDAYECEPDETREDHGGDDSRRRR